MSRRRHAAGALARAAPSFISRLSRERSMRASFANRAHSHFSCRFRMARSLPTPQGGVISPLLANLFLHYAFDMWMRRNFPDIPFERYADDAICHCRTEDQAAALRTALETRFADCG